MTATKQRESACSTCPWIKDGDRTCHFDPSTLEKTVVAAMNAGNIHACHSAKEFMCSGYLAFAEKNLRAGVYQLQMVRISDRLGMFNYDLVNKELNTFPSVKAMLLDHKKRMKRGF